MYRNDFQVKFIYHTWRHYGAKAGYLPFIHGTEAEILPLRLNWLTRRLFGRLLRRVAQRNNVRAYRQKALLKELAAAQHMWLRPFFATLYHTMWGDQDYRYLARFKPPTNCQAVMATYHQPASYFRDPETELSHLSALDGIIVVSRTQIPFFSQFIAPERIHFVPVGIDIDYFRPAPRPDNTPPLCLSVGAHLRDFATLSRVIRAVHAQEPTIRFVIVAGKKYHAQLDLPETVEVRHDVPDAELLHLYQQATALLMCLADSTANLAILESLACGLPIVATNIGGVPEYVSEECGVLTRPGDIREMANGVIALCTRPELRQQQAHSARQQALQFAWPNILDQTQTAYQTIYQNRGNP